jgi:hypothetical protein
MQQSLLISYPQWMDQEAWQSFTAMRKTIKKPLTDYAAKLIIYELQRIKDAGHCPNAALQQSIIHCWADVYQPKQKPIESNQGKSLLDKSQEWLRLDEEHRRAVREELRRKSA